MVTEKYGGTAHITYNLNTKHLVKLVSVSIMG